MADAPTYSSGAPIFHATMDSAVGAEELAPIKAPVGQPGAFGVGGGDKPLPTGRIVTVLTPDGKGAVGIDESFLQDALRQGYSVESDEHRSIRKYLENAGALDKAGVAAEGFLSGLTFGVSDPIIKKLDEEYTDPLTAKKLEAAREEFSGYGAVGTGAGFAASLLYGGPLFKGAAKIGAKAGATIAGEGAGFGAKVAGGMLGGATEGLVFSAPKAATEAVLGDPKKAAETLAFGAGVGVALGAAGPLWGGAKKGLSTVFSKPGEAGHSITESIDMWGSKKAVDALSLPKKYGEQLKAVVASDATVVADAEAQKAAGVAAGDDPVKFAGDLIRKEKLLRVSDSPATTVDRISTALKERDTEMEALVKDAKWAEADAPFVSQDYLAERILARAKKVGLEGGPATEQKMVDVVEALGKVAPMDGGMYSINQALKARRVLSNAIDYKGAPMAFNEALADVRHELNDIIHGQIEIRAKGTGNPMGRLRDLTREYSTLSVLEPGAAFGSLMREAAGEPGVAGQFTGGAVRRATGAAIGGLVGGPLGYKLGGLAGTFLGGRIGQAVGGALGPAGLKAAIGVSDGLLNLVGMLKKTGEHLERVPQALDFTLSSGLQPETGGSPLGAGATSAIIAATGPEKVKQFTQVATTLTQLANNPQKLKEMLDHLTGPYAEDAPGVAAEYASKMTEIVRYLDEKMPKAPEVASPFSPASAKQWQPSDAQINQFAKRVQVAANPFVVVQKLQNGTLTAAEVDTLKTLYPNTYTDIVGSITAYAMSGKAKPLSYAKRMKLSMLMGGPIDRSVKTSVVFYQGIYAADAAASEEANGGGGGGGGKMSSGGGLETEAQRLAK